ncbi:MAG TPA: selenide, water dikinase SelD [Flavihumibacter sp.]|nr:selenide, water dikinase SelD [Flavihumibacter sp.]
MSIKLTAYSHGAGCGCKIAPRVLSDILHTAHKLPAPAALLVGNETSDDAAVYDLGHGQALISTTDFFMPIVDDPFTFGRIAGANAISDVYAMGGRPLVAIAILGWPVDKLSPEIAGQVMEGGRSICAEAGIPLAGGHSIDNPEPIFGLSVNGLVNIADLKRNDTARAGDVLLLTKPLGIGVLSTAQKKGILPADAYERMAMQLQTLNKVGAALGGLKGVHAMTDVTGFGLGGHLLEMARGAGLQAQVQYNKLPVIEGVKELIAEKIAPGGTHRNWASYGSAIHIRETLPVEEAKLLVADPQTNGGLLIAVDPAALGEVRQLLNEQGLGAFVEPIGLLQALQSGEKPALYVA